MHMPHTIRHFTGAGIAVLAALAFSASGCATKKYVRAQVAPLEQKVGTLEGQTKENEKGLDELSTRVSRVDERALTADQKAEEAGRRAGEAGDSARQANQLAQNAGSLAEEANADADGITKRIDRLDNYQMVAENTVRFGFERSQLDEAAQAALDEVAGKLGPHKRYVIEVRGFTDHSGNRDYNLALSERRANAVVRYLTTRHNVPLYRIQKLGLGNESPVADNKTRDGREQNRRVEVKVYVADEAGLTAQGMTSSAQ